MRKFALFLGICTLLTPFSAYSQGRTLYVAGYGGSFADVMQSTVLPPFEKEHHVKVEFVAGNSTDTLAKLQATKGHPDIDVAIMDDGPMYQTLALGFCAPLQKGPNYANIYPLADLGPDAVGTGLVATGIAYNADAFKKNGWAPPTGWADLADPKYKGQLAMPGLDNTYGVETLLMYARLHGGSVNNIQPGFAYMQAHIAPNMDAFQSSPGGMAQLFQSGEIVAAVWGTSRVVALQQAGFPISFVYPKEGTPALMTTACVVHGAHDAADAQAFVDYLLSPGPQAVFAKTTGEAPVNRTVQLPPDEAKGIPYGPDAMSHLVTFNWTKINQQRAAWQQQWNRQIEQ